MRNFWLKCILVLIFGILKINSGGDPYINQPRLIVQDGDLTIRSGYNRNVSIVTNGDGRIITNNVNLNALSRSSASVNRRIAEVLHRYQTVVELTEKVNQLDDNVTDINQRINQFLGNEQNRITNRGMRRYFAKVKILEDKVNHLTELLSANECSSNPCRNGGTCVDTYNGYMCNCPSNWEGPTCESDVNECALYSGTAFGCQNGATCTNLPGSYRCDCTTNWFGIHCTEQHDDCSAASHQELCGHGTCVDEKRVLPGQPKYRCICEPGWTKAENSPACTQDVDECSGPQPKCSVSPRVLCFNLPGTFHCGPCPAGYTGNGLWCEDLNECEINNGGCSVNPFVECYNTPGSRRCGPCPSGYFGNGEQCMFQSVCNNNRGGCHPLATCIDNPAITATYRECRCPPGYVGNGEGLTGCVPTQGITCDNNSCQHGTCQMNGNSYRCICNAGYYGTNCETAEDPCLRNPCLNGGTCVRQSATFTCTCSSGYSGPTCAEQQRTCGGYLTADNGTLHYPEYSTHYDHEENCAWVIVVAPDKVINITFDHFHLEGGYNCEYDFLQLNDGPNLVSRTIGRFCSDTLHGESFTSTHDKVYLWFRSDRSISATGFTVRWKAVNPVCGGILNVTEYGSVSSPGYPGLYPVNRNCSWLVQVPFGKRIQFSFATLMLESHENCSYDYIKIFDGATDLDPVIGTYCSTITPPPLITSGHAANIFFHSDQNRQDSGFHIAYSALPGIDGCGGTLTAPQGIITSPNFPDSHSNNIECEWLIRVHPNNRIKITFEEFTVESHRNCYFDSLEIYDGPSETSGLLGRFCGNTLPPTVLSASHQLYVRFRVDMQTRMPGFKLQYKTICGGVYSDLTGFLTSPNYPEPYGAHTSCVYEIQLPPGYLVNLTIHTIEIEPHYECRWDYLEVRDGDNDQSPLSALLCGFRAPENIISTYNKLWIKFETDGSVQNRGFSAEYEAIEIGCGGIETDNNGQITSPRHPDRYPHKVSCTWLIRAPESHIIRLSFSAFNLENSGSCSFDYVLVEDTNGVQIGKFCGNRPPPLLTSMDNTLLVKFVTDESVSLAGFTANYEFFDARDTCGGDYYQTSGVIKSPGYPDHYPHSADCLWMLHAPNGRQIMLNVTDFVTEYHSNCKYDYLEIRNGGYKTSPLIGKYCGTQVMPIIRSHSNLLRLEFKSDSSMSAPGFEIHFDSTTVGCGGELTTSRGSIISPNYPQPYPVNADCEWLIRVSEGSTVSVSVVEIDIEEHQTCHYDYLQIFDGPTENSRSMVRICNNQQNPGPIVSTNSRVLIRFRSDFSEEAGGFKLVYQALCNNVLTKRKGVIESPNFPHSYPPNHNCSWTIQAPPGSNISISFSHLFIEGSGNCSSDYVEVLEVPPEPSYAISLGRFCGDMTKPPNAITTTSNTAIINLITDRSVSRQGFRLEWSFIGCGGDIIDKPYGMITSPNYPNGYPAKTVCYWHIWYPPGNSVELTLEDIDLEKESECEFDFFRVYGGENEQSPIILNACHSQTNATVITSHGNEIYIHFNSDISVTHRGFKASFKKLTTGCGGRFTANEATIMSPNFPDNYDFQDNCEWLIEVSSNHLVELEFYDFEVPSGRDNCSAGYVAIYDGSNSSSPLLLRQCGSNKPDGIISATGHQMLVKLVTDGYSIAKGFRAHYKTGCGRRLNADAGGEITSLGYPSVMNFGGNCSWIISTSQMGEKVVLTITHLHVISYNNCSRHSLQVYDGDMQDSPRIGKYCGIRMPPPIISRGSTLHVFLQNGGLFRATYGLVSQHCGGTFTGASGWFSSPGYPMNYDMEMECVWTIYASVGNKVHISFQSFHLENNDYCNTDYLEIHEDDPAGRLIGKYCGDNIPSNVTSASKLWIKFRSDDIGTAPGFMAHYEIEHGTTITGTSGEIASPGYPTKYIHTDSYEWTVIVPDGMFVSVQFLKIEIPAYLNNQNCYGTVKIVDGFDEEAPELGKFCGYTVPEPVFSTGNVITITFMADMHTGSLFHLKWSAVQQTGVSISTDSQGCLEEYVLNATTTAVIQSPNYPQNYPLNYNCTYMIRTIPTHHIVLQFERFNLEMNPTCLYDKLDHYYAPNSNVDSWTLNSTSCGRIDNLQLSSPNNLMKLEFVSDMWVTSSGFKGTAKSECGGQLFGNSGVLRSSDIFPSLQNLSTYETFECEWILTVKDRRTIQLTFENFNIESDSVCSNNYIMIRNGGFSTSPILGNGRYCGSNPPILPESSSNQVHVQLVYKPAAGRSPMFDLRYSTVTMTCGGHIYLTLDVPSAEISSPNYPSPPTNDAECEWIIVSLSSTRLRVDFETDFHLGPNCYSGDNLEYLDVRDGGTEVAPIIRRYCGNDQPSSAMSTGNALYMKYLSSSDARGAGFKARVKIAHCGGTISAMYATIKSPGFPQNYENSIECEWFLKMRLGYHISLTIHEFETPSSSNCSLTDFLEIRDMDAQGEVLGTYCGNPSNLPILIDVPGPEAYVKFKSSPSVTAKGFTMTMESDVQEGCGGVLNDPSGVITSPRYPNALTAFRECFWRIYAPAGRRIKVTFEEINLPVDENLNQCYSYVSVFNVTHRFQSRDFRRQYCGTTLPDEIDSSSSGMYIYFTTHGLTAGQGFKLRYSTDEEAYCGGVLAPPSGVFASPNFTVQNDTYMDCLWTADITENQTFVMKFDYLDLPGNMANFCRNSVFFAIANSRFLGGYCGNITNSFILTSPYLQTNLRLITTLDKPVGGFRGTYNITNCGGFVDGSDAVITSPGYPNNYPTGLDCDWSIGVPEGEVIQVHVIDLQLEDDCSKDYLLIRNGRSSQSPVLGKFCGSQTIAPIFTSTSGTVSVIFHSDAYGTAPGFKITTNEVQRGCGGLIHTQRGNFTSPNFPKSYNNNVECVWIIEQIYGYLIQVEFLGRFEVEQDGSCSKDYVQIDDMEEDNSWKLRNKFCGSTRPPTLISKTNKLRVIFHSNEQIRGDGFNLKYTAVCGGNFTKPAGEIFSPNYPDFYANNLNCTYIIGKSGDYISLEFDDFFSVEGHDSCIFDYVEIYKDSVSEPNKQGPYCGSEPPFPRTLPGPVIVRFVTDYGFVAHGFKLHYESLNCGAVLTSPTGIISTSRASRGTPTSEYLNNVDCTWHIVGQPNKVIQLRFIHFDVVHTHGCWADYLMIYDGNDTSSNNYLGRFCGEGVKNIKSTSGDLVLKFGTDSMYTAKGFTAYYYNTYGPEQGCGGGLNDTSGEIASLDVDSNGMYEPDLDCAWMIFVNEPDKIIKITFISFDLQMPSNGTCDNDYLEIREYAFDGPIIARHCGNILPGAIMTTANQVSVHFHSDSNENKSGFRLKYDVLPSPCGTSTLISTEEAKTLKSPNYPNAYPPNIRCKWTIGRNQTSWAFTNTIEVSVTDIDIPCGDDYLEIKRGQNDYYRTIPDYLKTCGNKLPQVMYFRQDPLIQLNSDAISNNGRGFSLTYKIGNCNKTYTDEGGIITNSRYPSSINYDNICNIFITTTSEKTISLYFKRIQTSYTSDCSYSYIKVYDGDNSASPSLGTYCGYNLPNPVFSTGNSLHLNFFMQGGIGLYHITYLTTDKGRGCGGSISANEGILSSPLYPQPYNVTGECKWQISVPGYHNVRLYFRSFTLSSTAGCDVNYLEIYEGASDDTNNRIVRYCGQDPTSSHELNSNDAVVKLVTDTTNQGSGFLVDFFASDYVPERTTTNFAQRFPDQG